VGVLVNRTYNREVSNESRHLEAEALGDTRDQTYPLHVFSWNARKNPRHRWSKEQALVKERSIIGDRDSDPARLNSSCTFSELESEEAASARILKSVISEAQDEKNAGKSIFSP